MSAMVVAIIGVFVLRLRAAQTMIEEDDIVGIQEDESIWCNSDVEGHQNAKRNRRQLRRDTNRYPKRNKRTGELDLRLRWPQFRQEKRNARTWTTT